MVVFDRRAPDGEIVRPVRLDKRPPANAPIPHSDADVRTSWGNYLHKPTLEGWAAEHLTGFNAWVKFIHTKIILVDPLTSAPIVITGSANYSEASTTKNEENTIVIRGDGSAAAQRVADIYLTEYQRLFMHFVYRDWASPEPGTAQAGHLCEGDSWSRRYYLPGSWRERQRRTFSGSNL